MLLLTDPWLDVQGKLPRSAQHPHRDVVEELRDFGLEVDVHDPWVDAAEAQREYGLDLVEAPSAGAYAGIILALAHDAFREMGSAQIRTLGTDKHLFFDLKNVFDADESDLRL